MVNDTNFRDGTREAPPIAALAPPCARCGHSGFVHAETPDRRCLYSACVCSDVYPGGGHVRPFPLRAASRPKADGSHPRGPDSIHVTARKSTAVLSLDLGHEEAADRVRVLARSGWTVVLSQTRPSVRRHPKT